MELPVGLAVPHQTGSNFDTSVRRCLELELQTGSNFDTSVRRCLELPVGLAVHHQTVHFDTSVRRCLELPVV